MIDRRTRRRALLASAIAGGAALIWIAAPFGPRQDASGSASPGKATRQASALIVAAGVVEPASDEVLLANEIGGTLRSVMVREGDSVRRGQILATINSDELTAQLASSRAALALRAAEVEKLRAGARAQERREAAASLLGAQARLESTSTRLTRLRALERNGFAARASLEEAVAAQAEASAARDVAAERSALINAPPRAEDVRIAVAALGMARAEVNRAAAAAEKSFIRAPIDGTVLRVLAQPGEVMAVLRPTVVATIGDLRSLRVRTEVDEADIGHVKPGQAAYVTVDAYPGRRFAGFVTRAAGRMGTKEIAVEEPSSRKDARVLEVIVRLNPGVSLPIGLRCDVFITRPLS